MSGVFTWRFARYFGKTFNGTQFSSSFLYVLFENARQKSMLITSEIIRLLKQFCILTDDLTLVGIKLTEMLLVLVLNLHLFSHIFPLFVSTFFTYDKHFFFYYWFLTQRRRDNVFTTSGDSLHQRYQYVENESFTDVNRQRFANVLKWRCGNVVAMLWQRHKVLTFQGVLQRL